MPVVMACHNIFCQASNLCAILQVGNDRRHMIRYLRKLVSFALRTVQLIAVLSFLTLDAHCANQIPAIQMKQSHYFLGDHLVTAAKDAVRIENTGRFKFIVVARAPDWRINIFRNDDKTYFSESLKEFEETGLVSDFLVTRRDRYLDPRDFRSTPIKFLGAPAMRVTGRRRALKFMPLEKGAAQQVEQVIHSAYKLPTDGGLPLEETDTIDHPDFISGAGNKGRRETELSTSSINQVTVAADIFALPKNYVKAKSVREVVAGSDVRKESVDAQDLFDAGRRK